MTLGNSYGLEIYCLVCIDKNRPQRIYKQISKRKRGREREREREFYWHTNAMRISSHHIKLPQWNCTWLKMKPLEIFDNIYVTWLLVEICIIRYE